MKNDPRMDAAWLAQYTSVDESALTPKQKDFVAQMRGQFATGKVGRRASDGRVDFYVLDADLGPIQVELPQ